MTGTVPVVTGVAAQGAGAAGIPIVKSPFGCGRLPSPAPAAPVAPPLPAVPVPTPVPPSFDPGAPDDEQASADASVTIVTARPKVCAPRIYSLLAPWWRGRAKKLGTFC